MVYPEQHEDFKARVQEIVQSMDVDALVGQMTQLDISMLLNDDKTINEDKVRHYAKLKIGSYLNSPFNGGPVGGKIGYTAEEWRHILTTIQRIHMEENNGNPIIYGIDSVHGAIYVQNAVVFGQQINAAATFNPELVYEMGRFTGHDTEAAGIPWIFAPILDVSKNPLWPRTFETFGEDPHVVSVMGAAIVKGMQSNPQTAACLKHFIGYSKSSTGHDKDPVSISDYELLNHFATPFLASIHAGAKTIMENYVSVNDVPMMINTKLMRDLVRHDMEFEGLIVTDWDEINNLHNAHRVAKSKAEAVALALSRTSIDISMVPFETSFIDHAKALAEADPAFINRLRESVTRIVRLKLELGLYETPVPGLGNIVGGEDSKQAALEMARESIVLLQNIDQVLPLPENTSVFVTGHAAHNIGYQCGGWTLQWQGTSGNEQFPHGISLWQGLQEISPDNTTYMNGLAADGSITNIDEILEKAAAAVYTIVTVGEGSYSEKPGDIETLDLAHGQQEYVRRIAATGTKVILVLIEGRPRLLHGLPKVVHAVVHAMLPGELGGKAIAEILYGKINPSGRLPLTYPCHAANVLVQYNHRSMVQITDKRCNFEWTFGHGLSYSSFEYSELCVSRDTIDAIEDTIEISVVVTNTSTIAGKEVVMLFIAQPYRLIAVPEVKLLKHFTKIFLEGGASTTVKFKLAFNDFSVFAPNIGQRFSRIAEKGEYIVLIKPETSVDVYNDSWTHPLAATFHVTSDLKQSM
ncbi:glycoside hydrolase [Thraustotheca clavata]|uniref:beta-glucosidase n=1 Tax=Thraustotheca clavata TaxID=74557 RepID=A0A1V9Z052_9STRA|nr:glycoside hydrolase [Thraustotheca clavata]